MYFFKKDKKIIKTTEGFTLIETFVAITVLVIALAGPFTLVMKSLAVSKITKGQITAMYLAQEAIEYVRNIRDENILMGNYWLTDLNGRKVRFPITNPIQYYNDSTSDCVSPDGSKKCIVDAPYRRTVTRCLGVCPPLKFNSISKLYGYNVSADPDDISVFTRTVEIDEIVSNIEVVVTVTMEWQGQDDPGLRTFVMQEHLLNWQ